MKLIQYNYLVYRLNIYAIKLCNETGKFQESRQTPSQVAPMHPFACHMAALHVTNGNQHTTAPCPVIRLTDLRHLRRTMLVRY